MMSTDHPIDPEVKLSDPRPASDAEVNSTQLAEARRVLAQKLREEHPGRWAIISEGHTSIKSAGVVRRRLANQKHWEGFEMTSRKSEDPDKGFAIHARYVGVDAVKDNVESSDED